MDFVGEVSSYQCWMNGFMYSQSLCIAHSERSDALTKNDNFFIMPSFAVERSINLAYSAVETFPDSTLHITNELIHNPMVNERLHKKNVNFIEKDGENAKDFSQIKEGDVVMLPAFGATLDEMK